MSKKRKSYSKQFKIDAVKLVTEQGYKATEAARSLELTMACSDVGKNNLKKKILLLFQGMEK
jgi:transposase-like protein